LLHGLVAAIVYAVATRLHDRRVGFWSAFAYASLPGVSLSAFLISTDAVLLPCWAAALYAFIRVREPGGSPWWWTAVGAAAGLGLLSKYAMMYWLLSALLYLLWIRSERRHLKGFAIAAAIAFAIYLPNLWWNWSHGFVSYLHVRDNAHLPDAGFTGPTLHPLMLLEFFGSQFGVFGPGFFALLIAVVLRPKALAEPRVRVLAVFALPTLAMMLTVSLLSRAQPNWAAPIYVSAIVLVTAWALQEGWRRLVAWSIALNFALAIVLFGSGPTLAAVGIEVPAKYDPLHRLRGWRELGQGVSAALAAYPGLTLLADDRELLAALIYYVHPHPFDAVNWNVIPGIKNQWGISNNLDNHIGEDFLAVTEHGLVNQMQRLFVELTPITTITTASGPGGGRTYTLYIARGYRGEPPNQ
jgi:4-amino-4-deoxy-L-arabinose transferase-like glycosyltransferase